MDELKIVKGNEFKTIVEVEAYKYNGDKIKDFDLLNCTNIKVLCAIDGIFNTIKNIEILLYNKLLIYWPSNLKIGKYSLLVTGKYNNEDWRFYDKTSIFTIVNTNKEANIPTLSIVDEDFYIVNKQRLYILCPKGDKGDTGATGPQGPIGPKGDKGDKGDSATIDTLTNIDIENLLRDE